MMSTSSNPDNKQGSRGLDWSILMLAVMATFGLVLALFTAWDAWSRPMDFVPQSYWLTALTLAATICGAIVMTRRPQLTGLKVFLACLILIGIFLQLNVLNATQISHKAPGQPTTTSPAAAAQAQNPTPAPTPTPTPAPAK